ncbi:MAG: hypothetical protein ABFD16_24325, partial [Thermoguttaceae bacterium]
MPILVQCSSCRGKFHAPDESAGRHAKCPKCHETLLIPFGSDANRTDSTTVSLDEYALAEQPTRTTPSEQAVPCSSSCPLCGAAIREKAVLCVSCGYDFRTGERLETEFVHRRPELGQDCSLRAWSRAVVRCVRNRPTLLRLAAAIALIAAPFFLHYPVYKLFSALGLLAGDAPGRAMGLMICAWLYGLFSLTCLAGALVAVRTAVQDSILAALGLWVVLIIAVGFVSSVLHKAMFGALYQKTALYSVEAQNRTGEDCLQCEVDFGPRYSGPLRYAGVAGGCANGSRSVCGGFPDPAPTEATVYWKTASGVEHTQTVALKSLRGKALAHVTYVFILGYDGIVRAAPFTHEELLAQRDAKFACDNGPTYCVGVKNLTKGRLSDVAVRFDRYQVNAGSYVDAPGRGNSFVFSFGLPY